MSEKKWVKPTDDMKKTVAYHILIEDKHYAVYNIPDAYHSLGSDNGNPYEDNYFVYFSKDWVPFVSKGVHRICWEIKYKQRNSSKYKWDEWRFSNVGYCEMWANGKLIYGFFARSTEFALSKAQALTTELLEFPGYNFIKPEENMNKKVWWYGLPATIKPKLSEPWEITVWPDYSTISKEEWWKEYDRRTSNYMGATDEEKKEHAEDMAEDISSGSINWGDALAAGGRINWFRK